jgi:hypothetical protein
MTTVGATPMKRTILISIVLTVASILPATVPLAAACAPKQHQFDFLLGNWVVRDRSGRVLGVDSVSQEPGGCSLIELWRAASSGHEGLGVINYRPGDDTWHQDLMIHIGFVLSADGGMDGASMVMTGREYPGPGVIRLHRLRWTPASDGSVEQLWQTSIDDGQSWQVHFEGVFQRISE